MYDTLLDPNSGHCSRRGGESLTIWIGYIFDYKLRQDPLLLPNGDLAPNVAKLKSSLRLENQQPFELWVRRKFSYKTAFDIRRDVLRKMGRSDLADRPVPTHVPGNQAYMDERVKALKAQAAARLAKEKKGATDRVSRAPSQRFARALGTHTPHSRLASPFTRRLLAAATRLIRR
ncbi:hypothetical protein D9613_008038 [Agrocybe pediades]|uniref:Uncharacterized protein n=1 Tax=Agrocybe pediades TaxID=84607 RepID=A0A8H4VMQ5_9AGAR|nr:hypothetical protein D9613_008038 [Agrocybe pediades]